MSRHGVDAHLHHALDRAGSYTCIPLPWPDVARPEEIEVTTTTLVMTRPVVGRPQAGLRPDCAPTWDAGRLHDLPAAPLPREPAPFHRPAELLRSSDDRRGSRPSVARTRSTFSVRAEWPWILGVFLLSSLTTVAFLKKTGFFQPRQEAMSFVSQGLGSTKEPARVERGDPPPTSHAAPLVPCHR